MNTYCSISKIFHAAVQIRWLTHGRGKVPFGCIVEVWLGDAFGGRCGIEREVNGTGGCFFAGVTAAAR